MTGDPRDRPRAVVGVGPAPEDLAAGVVWHEIPLPPEDAVPNPAALLRWLRRAAQDGVEAFVVPPAQADWLADHPAVVAALVAAFPLAAADARAGFAFSLASANVPAEPETGSSATEFRRGEGDPDERPRGDESGGPPIPSAIVEGWSLDPERRFSFVAETDLDAPRVVFSFAEPPRGVVRGEITLVARGIETLRLRCRLEGGGGGDGFVDMRDPSLVHHTLDYFGVLADPATGAYQLDFDLKTPRDAGLATVALDLAEPRNWRVHPDFPGGRSLRLRPTAPRGAELGLVDLSFARADEPRRNPGWQGAANWSPPRRPAKTGRRDAVIFSSWAPESALPLAEYFLEVLGRYHADSKIFVGINHGSSPRWRQMLVSSGLDVEACDAPPAVTLSSDVSATVAALNGYRRCREAFDLVWFGHTKGASRLQVDDYGRSRWVLQRWFWGQRDEVEGVFADPTVGVWAPHWLMFQPEHRAQTDALRRMYDAPCAPLCAMAVSTHYVVRAECLRAFVDGVHPTFFTHGPEPFGGDRYFGEFALPNVPIVQGYEPAIGEGLGGTSVYSPSGTSAILSDWRQNNAMARFQLERWRQDPTTYEPPRIVHQRIR